ncbi:hypothetical protein Trydic_g4277 [Trypoxylus dichotomus]
MDSWLDEYDGLGSTVFTKIVSSPALRAKFVANAIAFLQRYRIGGFDLDWEYPAQRGGAATDNANFSKLLAEFRAEFDRYGYLLTAAVAAVGSSVNLSYEVPQLSKFPSDVTPRLRDLRGPKDASSQ